MSENEEEQTVKAILTDLSANCTDIGEQIGYVGYQLERIANLLEMVAFETRVDAAGQSQGYIRVAQVD